MKRYWVFGGKERLGGMRDFVKGYVHLPDALMKASDLPWSHVWDNVTNEILPINGFEYAYGQSIKAQLPEGSEIWFPKEKKWSDVVHPNHSKAAGLPVAGRFADHACFYRIPI